MSAWEILLAWMTTGEVPELPEVRHSDEDSTEVDERREAAQLLAISCWPLGDAYNIPKFQDELVLQLMAHFQIYGVTKNVLSRTLHLSPVGSKLTKLVLEDAVMGCMSNDDVEAAIDGKNALSEFLRARERHRANDSVFDHRLDLGGHDFAGPYARWTDYVSESPHCHWVYTYVDPDCLSTQPCD